MLMTAVSSPLWSRIGTLTDVSCSGMHPAVELVLSLRSELSRRDTVDVTVPPYRDFARRQPNLYRLMTERPLRRDLLTAGVEEAAAMPLLDATGGDRERARAIWAFAHGLVILELNLRFPTRRRSRHRLAQRHRRVPRHGLSAGTR